MILEKSSGLIYKLASKRVKYTKKYLDKSAFNLAGYETKVNFESLTELSKEANDKKNKENKEYFKYKHILTNLDPEMFNKISRNDRFRNNRFLIPDRYIQPLCKHLKFTEHDLLFGNLEEIKIYAGEFYYLLFLDILDMKKNPLKQLLTIVLMDYAHFSKVESYKNLVEDSIKNCDGYKEGSLETFYSLIDDYHKPLSPKNLKNKKTIENIIEETSNELIVDIIYSLKEYGLIEFIDYKEIGIDIIASSIKIFNLRKQYNQSRATVIGKFFLMYNQELIDILIAFSYETDSFKKLPKKLVTFFTSQLLNLLYDVISKTKPYTLNLDSFKENSYGHRIHKIIKSDIQELCVDISSCNQRIDRLKFDFTNEFEYKNKHAEEQKILATYRMQLRRVKKYIETLHQIQWRKDNGLSSNKSIARAELSYKESLINHWEKYFQETNCQ